MFQINDYVIYKNEVCLVKEIKQNFMKNQDYYALSPLLDSSLTINLPINSNLLHPILSKEEALKLIATIPSIKPIENNEKLIEQEYKKLLHSENKEDLVRIMKTTYLRNDKRLKNGKQVGEIDETYFEKAEKLLYSELAFSLNKNYEETKKFVIDTIIELTT